MSYNFSASFTLDVANITPNPPTDPATLGSGTATFTIPLVSAAALGFSAVVSGATAVAYSGPTPTSAQFLAAAILAAAPGFVDAAAGTATNIADINGQLALASGSPTVVLTNSGLQVTYDGASTSMPTFTAGDITITIPGTATTFSSAPAPAPTGTSKASPMTIRYKKVVCWGLSPQAVSFAQSGSMGHRVSIIVPVDLMNKFFRWTRASGEVAPTGRFLNKPNASDVFADELEKAFNGGYTDLDGVASGLNFSSSALDIAGDIKRDVNLPASAAGTRYSANDLVMAYLMYKCFGSSSYDPTDVIYNVDDAFSMLTSKQLAELITDSLEAEDALANAAVLPNGKNVAQQLPGDNKGQVDSMFRSFLAADPLRYFLDGKQIPGLFETNFGVSASDPSVNGNWCLTVGDKIEVPLKLVFRAPVSVLSVQDNVQNPSSATPDSVQTTMIRGEAATFDCASQKAAPSNEIPIRLQITCGPPTPGAGTGSTSGGAVGPLAIGASSSVIFYTPKNYGAQSAIPVVASGGTAPYTYSMVLPAGLSSDLTLSSDGVLSFNAATAAAVTKWGKWMVPITVIDSATPAATKKVYVNMSLEDGNGASNNSLWISSASKNIGSAATLAPYSASAVVQPRQVLQYAHAPYGMAPPTTGSLKVNELLSSDELTFTYLPPPTGSLGAFLPATPAATVEWKITSESGKVGSSALPTGVTFTPATTSGLTAVLEVDLETAPVAPAVAAKAGLYNFLITVRDENNYVQSFPVTINIVKPPVRSAAAPLGATSSNAARTADELKNGGILRIAAGASAAETITLVASGTATDCVWSLSKVFGDAAGVVLGSATVDTNTVAITRGSHPAGTSCILVTCLDANNVSHTIFYTVVLE